MGMDGSTSEVILKRLRGISYLFLFNDDRF